ncbi:hypothetical protein D3C81_1729680 [compost metagenome]
MEQIAGLVGEADDAARERDAAVFAVDEFGRPDLGEFVRDGRGADHVADTAGNQIELELHLRLFGPHGGAQALFRLGQEGGPDAGAGRASRRRADHDQRRRRPASRLVHAVIKPRHLAGQAAGAARELGDGLALLPALRLEIGLDRQRAECVGFQVKAKNGDLRSLAAHTKLLQALCKV